MDKPREITPAEVREVHRRALAGESPVMIGKALGRSPNRIEQLVLVLGLTPTYRARGRPRKEREPKESRPPGRPRIWTDDILATIREKREQGMSYRRIGEELKPPRSGQWVFRLLHAENDTGEPRRYWCRVGRHNFESRARYGPERCARCGALSWRDGEDES